MTARPYSAHFHKPTSDATYYTLLTINLAILIIFAIVTYVTYIGTYGTEYSLISFITVIPAIAGGLFFALLALTGRKAFRRELAYLRKYRFKTSPDKLKITK